MSGENILVVAIVLGFYPAAVLCVALTGPHSEFERNELRKYRAERSRPSTPGTTGGRDAD